MTALSFVWVHPYSQISGCDSYITILYCIKFIFIFPSIYDGKVQWSTSGIENVADFCHFVT